MILHTVLVRAFQCIVLYVRPRIGSTVRITVGFYDDVQYKTTAVLYVQMVDR